MILHFYIYNNCPYPVIVSVSHLPLSEETRKITQVEVQPGNQSMVCTTSNPKVVAQAVSKAGTTFWFWQVHTLDEEYTLVVSDSSSSEFPNPDFFRQPNLVID